MATPVPGSPSADSGGDSTKEALLVSVSVLSSLLVFILGLWLYLRSKSMKKRKSKSRYPTALGSASGLTTRSDDPSAPTVIIGDTRVSKRSEDTKVSRRSDSTKLSKLTQSTKLSKRSADGSASKMHGTTVTFTLAVGQKELSIPAYLEVDLHSEVTLGQKIDQGGNSTIYKVNINDASLMSRSEGNICIAKVLSADITDEERAVFHQEIAIMSYFYKSKNFAKLVGYAESPPIIFLKYYTMGSLFEWVRKGHPTLRYSTRSVLRFATNIAVAMKELHDNDFVHCDIKPANVLLNYDVQIGFHAVLTDFGIARILNESSALVEAFKVVKKDGWSINYCPPEAFEKIFRQEGDTTTTTGSGVTIGDECTKRALKSADIFMFAMSMYEMIFRRVPYDNYPDSVAIVEAIWEGTRPDMSAPSKSSRTPDPIIAEMISIMVDCWSFIPEERPEAATIIQRLRRLKPAKDHGSRQRLESDQQSSKAPSTNDVSELILPTK